MPYAEPVGHAKVPLDPRVHWVDWPSSQRAVGLAKDKVLPIERVERGVVLEVKPVAEGKRFPGQHLQLAFDVVGIDGTPVIPSHGHPGPSAKPVFFVLSDP